MLKKSYKKFLNKEIIYFMLEKIWRGIISSNQRNYETKRNDCVKLPETVLKTISDSSDRKPFYEIFQTVFHNNGSTFAYLER